MATITALRATPISIPLKTPYEWSGGHYGGFSRTIVEIEVSDGVVGLGESYSPDDAMVINTLFASRLVGADPSDLADCERRCLSNAREQKVLGDISYLRAFTGIEIALWDVKGKLEGKSVSRLLGGRVRDAAPMTEYFAFRDGHEQSPLEVANYCAKMVENHGAVAFEGKVGARDLATEVAMVREIRAAVGDELPVRLDANMAWTTENASLALKEFEEFNIVSIEEPVATLQELARLRAKTKIGFSTHCANLKEAVALGVPDAFVIGFGLFGGIRRTANFIAACAPFGINVWFRSPEAGIATAAQLQLVAATEELSEPSQTLLRWHDDEVLAQGCFEPKEGKVTIPDQPGLGVTLDPVALARCHDRFIQHGQLDLDPPGSTPPLSS